MNTLVVSLSLACCVAVADVRAQAARAAVPDIVMLGGKVFTSDSTHRWAQALAIRGDRIVAVGTTTSIRALAGPATRIINLAGRVVIPGINDAHDHMEYSAPLGVAFHTTDSSLAGPTFAEVLDSVRVISARTAHGVWLSTNMGRRILDDTLATRRAMDPVAPNNPIMFATPSGHMVLLNTVALRLFGIADDAPDPLGGWYERESSGRLTGGLQEYAYWSPNRRLNSALPQRVLVAAMREYAQTGLQYGITSVQDMATGFDPATTIRLVHLVPPPFRLRIIKFSIPSGGTRRIAEWDSVERHPAPFAVVSGRKWILEGTGVERTSLRRTAYPARPGWNGRLDFPPDTIRAILREALATREQLMLHVGADSALSLVLSLMHSLAPDSVWRPLRVRFEHADGLDLDLQRAAKRMGVIVVLNPTHHPMHELFRSTADLGIPIAIGSDGARNPYLNMMLLVDRPDNQAEAITREEVVVAYTRGSAFAEFAEREKGMLAPGMLADLVVLSQDIFTVPVNRLPETSSVLTMVGGRIAYERPHK